MRKWTFALLTVLLFLSLAVPVWADDGDDQVVFFGDRVVIRAGEVVDGSLIVIGGSAELREGGQIRGDMVAIGGESIVDGRIGGNLVVVGGTLELRSHATIEEDFFTLGASVSRAEGATILGETIEGMRWRLPALRIRPWVPQLRTWGERWRSPGIIFGDAVGSLFRWVARTIALMALAVVVMLILPKQTALVGETASTLPLPSTGVGLLTVMVLLIVLPLLVIICIGIPVAILLAMAAAVALLLGRVAVAAVLGQRLLAALNANQSQPLLEAVVGIVVIELLSAVPCLGWLASTILSLAGLGAVVLTRFGTVPYEPTSTVADLPAPPPQPDLPSAPGEEE